eukprot:s391_g4.t1
MKAELLSFIEEVYTAQYNQAMGVQRKKKSVVTVAGHRYGLPSMVGQVCWNVAKSVELYRADHEGIETFARFLEECYDTADALFYLKMRCAARQVSKTSVPAGARPQLTLKKALAAVREGIGKEAPDSLKASIFARLKHQSGGGEDPIDWDRFLLLCVQEYRKVTSCAAVPATVGQPITCQAEGSLRVTACAREAAVTGAATLLRAPAHEDDAAADRAQGFAFIAKYLLVELQQAASAKAVKEARMPHPSFEEEATMPTTASFPEEAASLDAEPWMYALFRKHPGEGCSTQAKKVWPPRSVVRRMQQEKMEDEKLTKASLTDFEACELHKNRVAAEWGRLEVGCLRWLSAFPRPVGPSASTYTACGVSIMHELLQEERRQFLEL